MPYKIIDRRYVPAGSFRYAQLASDKSFAVAPELWAVCLNCSKCKNEADNGASGFDTVLVAHFLFHVEDDARQCADNLSGHGPVTIVRPA